ncbi:MAG: 50S ribosomal protein L19e [Candidatus Micrarchaeota archaeon]
MSMKTVRRVASGVLKCGESKIRIRPADAKKAEEALTRDDIRALVKQGAVYALPKRGVSRARAREKHAKLKRGRRRGMGSRKGGKYAGVPRKMIWMSKVRAQRGLLRELADSGKLLGNYRNIYRMVKGRAFRSKEAMLAHLKDSNLIKK